MVVLSVDIADAASQLTELVERAAHGGERIVITRQGKPLAALINAAELSLPETAASSDAATASSSPPPLSDEDYAEFAASIQEVVWERQRPNRTRPPINLDN